MKIIGYHYGHPWYWDEEHNQRWSDTHEIIKQHSLAACMKIDRACVSCKKFQNEDGTDPCLGKLPGVVAACCGHGERGYIAFENGVNIHFYTYMICEKGVYKVFFSKAKK